MYGSKTLFQLRIKNSLTTLFPVITLNILKNEAYDTEQSKFEINIGETKETKYYEYNFCYDDA